jgi:hypothetical protein
LSGVPELNPGGDGWESNPPGAARHRPSDGFEDRGGHQPPNIPLGSKPSGGRRLGSRPSNRGEGDPTAAPHSRPLSPRLLRARRRPVASTWVEGGHPAWLRGTAGIATSPSDPAEPFRRGPGQLAFPPIASPRKRRISVQEARAAAALASAVPPKSIVIGAPGGLSLVMRAGMGDRKGSRGSGQRARSTGAGRGRGGAPRSTCFDGQSWSSPPEIRRTGPPIRSTGIAACRTRPGSRGRRSNVFRCRMGRRSKNEGRERRNAPSPSLPAGSIPSPRPLPPAPEPGHDPMPRTAGFGSRSLDRDVGRGSPQVTRKAS